MKILRFFGVLLILVLAVILIGPLIIPIPPLPEGRPVEELADSDSRFIQVGSIDVHYKVHGSGEPVIILLHGFASSTYSWEDVIQPLAEMGTVIAYDRPAFGLTERPMEGEWTGESPYSSASQVKMLVGLMDALEIENAVLIGHSAGAMIAMQTTLAYPERVSGMVLVDPAVSAKGGVPQWFRPFIDTPQMERIGPYFSRTLNSEQGDAFLDAAWYDPSKFTDEDMAAYRRPFQLANWDLALWEFTKASRGIDLSTRYQEFNLPVIVISGDNDRIVPPEESKKLAEALPKARYEELTKCGHVPQEECPEGFLPLVKEFIGQFEQ